MLQLYLCYWEKHKLGAKLTSGKAASFNVKWESFELAYLEDTIEDTYLEEL